MSPSLFFPASTAIEVLLHSIRERLVNQLRGDAGLVNSLLCFTRDVEPQTVCVQHRFRLIAKVSPCIAERSLRAATASLDLGHAPTMFHSGTRWPAFVLPRRSRMPAAKQAPLPHRREHLLKREQPAIAIVVVWIAWFNARSGRW